MKKHNNKFWLNLELWQWWPAILILIIYFSTLLFPAKFIPDYFRIGKLENSKLILRTIITVQGSIFGILFAVIILHFNLSKEVFGRGVSNIFQEYRKQFYFCIFIITNICVSFMTLLLLESNLIINLITPVYLCSLLFLLAIILVYPVLLLSFKKQDTSSQISKLIHSIEKEHFTISNYRKSQNELNQVKEIEKNPIYILRETALNVLQKDDTLLVQLIIKQTSVKAIKILEDKNSSILPIQVIGSFNIIWDVIFQKAIEKKNYSVLNYAWVIYNCFFKHILNNKKQIQEYEELILIFKNFLSKIVEGGFNQVVKNSMRHIANSIIFQIKNNCPKENEISDIRYYFEKDFESKIQHDFIKNQQWNFITHEMINIFPYILDRSLSCKNQEIFNDTQWAYSFFILDISQEEIGEKLKHLIIIDAFSTSYYKCQLALEKNLFNNTDEIKVFRVEDLFEWLKDDKTYFKRCFSIVSDFVLECCEKEQFGNMYYWHFNFGAIGRKCAIEYNNHQKYAECLNYIIEIYSRLRVYFEKNLNRDGLKYLNIIEELNSFIAYHKQDNYNLNQELIENINNEIAKFKKSLEIQEILNNQKIKWNPM